MHGVLDCARHILFWLLEGSHARCGRTLKSGRVVPYSLLGRIQIGRADALVPNISGPNVVCYRRGTTGHSLSIQLDQIFPRRRISLCSSNLWHVWLCHVIQRNVDGLVSGDQGCLHRILTRPLSNLRGLGKFMHRCTTFSTNKCRRTSC